ncbi:galacturonan 1,4-alpha-galacturonidase [Ranunculus cassubicifolius]
MKRTKNSPVFLLLLLLIIFAALFTSSIEARKNHNKKTKGHKHQKQRKGGGSGNYAPGPEHAPAPAPSHGSYPTSDIFDVLSYGAKGDGIADDSKALQAAWKAACRVGFSTVRIPSGSKFLIKPISLQGPCMPHLALQIDGTLLAPSHIGSWPKSSLFQWLNFKWIQNFTIQGSGTINGQGSAWWNLAENLYTQKRSKYVPEMKPTALRFYESYNVTVRDIKIINSPLCHLKFDDSGSIQINNITISSPENSPNTDGIHLQNTKDVEIQHSNIGCGDDCVSIQTGCSNIHVHDCSCGPGHGISVGSLGKNKAVGCVSNIVVENIIMQDTLYGVRIKTWQGGIGSVKNVSFSNIQVTNVKVPIMIDQFYCDKKICKNQTEAIAISRIKYNRIIGTYSVQPIHLACSNNVPCTNVDLTDIQLEPTIKSLGFQQALCLNSYGRSFAPLVPSSIDYCLRRGGGSYSSTVKSRKYTC